MIVKHFGNLLNPLSEVEVLLRILLVEDCPSDAFLVREAVSSFPAKAHLVTARDGEKAFQLINDFHFEPDMVFMDLDVPKLDSFEFIQRVRASQDIPVIVLSGSVDPADAERAFKMGAREYIVKPIQVDEFFSKVREAIGRWSSHALSRGA